MDPRRAVKDPHEPRETHLCHMKSPTTNRLAPL